jgi:hypothetical protein
MLGELESEGQRKASAFEMMLRMSVAGERSSGLMGVLDEFNSRFGRGALGTSLAWVMKQELVTSVAAQVKMAAAVCAYRQIVEARWPIDVADDVSRKMSLRARRNLTFANFLAHVESLRMQIC